MGVEVSLRYIFGKECLFLFDLQLLMFYYYYSILYRLQTPRMRHPNPFHLGSLKKTLTERETEGMYSSMK